MKWLANFRCSNYSKYYKNDKENLVKAEKVIENLKKQKLTYYTM